MLSFFWHEHIFEKPGAQVNYKNHISVFQDGVTLIPVEVALRSCFRFLQGSLYLGPQGSLESSDWLPAHTNENMKLFTFNWTLNRATRTHVSFSDTHKRVLIILLLLASRGLQALPLKFPLFYILRSTQCYALILAPHLIQKKQEEDS